MRHRQHQLLSLRIGRELDDLDGDRPDPPRRTFAPHRERAVRRVELAHECSRRGVHGFPRPMARDQPPVGQRDEDRLVAFGFASCRRDRVPFARARNAGDAGLDPAKRPRVVDQVT